MNFCCSRQVTSIKNRRKIQVKYFHFLCKNTQHNSDDDDVDDDGRGVVKRGEREKCGGFFAAKCVE